MNPKAELPIPLKHHIANAPKPPPAKQQLTDFPKGSPAKQRLVDVLREAAERGQAVHVMLDSSHAAATTLPSSIDEFGRTGVFAREGMGPGAVVATLLRTGRRFELAVIRPGGHATERRRFESLLGASPDLSDPAVLKWLTSELEDLQIVDLPTLLVVDQEYLPLGAPAPDLSGLAARIPCCVALIQDAPGTEGGIEWRALHAPGA